jgi:hypothetical protein
MTNPSTTRLRRALLSLASLAALALGGCRQSSPYDLCFTSADCPINLTCQTVGTGDRICTRACSATDVCPADAQGDASTCVSFDGGSNATCWESCVLGSTDRADSCSSGFTCTDVDAGPAVAAICIPTRRAGARPYASCTVAAGCAGGTECFSVSSTGARMCTRSCNSEADCPTDAFGTSARCISFDGGANFECFQACNISAGGSECEGSFGCFDRDASGSTFPPICLPR